MMACYCRVSTRRQKADSQKADIQRWLTGHAVPPTTAQWFEDVDSGTTLARPAFELKPPTRDLVRTALRAGQCQGLCQGLPSIRGQAAELRIRVAHPSPIG
jgi:hypothetical protein